MKRMTNSQKSNDKNVKTSALVKILAVLGILLFSTFTLFACGEDNSNRIQTISISQSTITLVVGNTEQLTYTTEPSSAINADVHYASANSSIATVDRNGVITAVSVGETTVSVTAENGGATDAVTVRVIAEPIVLSAPTNVTFDGEKIVWDRVDNNYGYEVTLNGIPYQQTVITTYFTDFQPGVQYTVTVRALGNDRTYFTSEYSQEFTFMQYPAPTIEISAGVIYITANSDANTFQILMNGETHRERLNATQYIIEDTLDVGRYSFQVIALGNNSNNTYNSPASNLISISKLAAPTNAQIEDRVLTFDSVTGAQAYTIMIVNNETQETSYRNVNASSSLVTVDLWDGYVPGQYNIYIKAVGDNRTTLDSAYSTEFAVDKLSQPQNLQINNGILTWDSVDRATGYVLSIQYNGQTTLEENIPLPTFDFASKYINAGEYYIQVMATGSEIDGVNRFVNSDYSTVLTVNVLAAPTNISIRTNLVFWDNVELSTGYLVLLDESQTMPIQENNYISFQNTDTQTFVAKNYSFKVRAVGNGTNIVDSQYSTTFNFKKLSTIQPEYVTLSGSIVSWASVADAVVYYVYVNGATSPVAVSGTTIDFGADTYAEGEYSITVQAISTANNAVNGEQSSPITFTKLPAPSNFRVDNGVLTYSMPDGSSYYGYNLRVGRTEYTNIVDESLHFDQYIADDGNTTVSLQAVGDGQSTISSNYSASINIHKISSAVNLAIENGILVWDSVSGATTYQINVDLTDNEGQSYTQTMEVDADEPTMVNLMTDELFSTAGVYAITMKVIGATTDVSDLSLTYDVNSKVSVPVNTRKLQDIETLRVQSGVIVWDAVVGAVDYEIFLDGVSRGPQGTGTSYTVEGSAGAHTVRVYARGNNSSVLDANNEDNTISVTKLSNIFNFSLNGSTIMWDAIQYAYTYDIEIRNASNEVLRTATNISATSYSVYSVDGNQTLYVRVRANGDNNNVVSGDYGALSGGRYFEVGVLETPSSLRIEDNILYFNYVANALNYELVISYGATQDTQVISAVEDQTQGTFDLGAYLDGRTEGIYSLFMRASDDLENQSYLSSSYTNSMSVEKLGVPVISLYNGIIMYSSITNASSYNLTVQDSSSAGTTDFELDRDTNNFVMDTRFSAGQYNIFLQAIGDGTRTISGAVSAGYAVEKLRTPIASTETAQDLEVQNGQIVWNAVDNASLYSIVVYQYDSIAQEFVQSYTQQLQPTANNSYLPTGSEGNYRISIQVIGDDSRYVSSDIYMYAQTLQKLRAPDNLHIENGIVHWSNNSQAENGYSMTVNNVEFNVGSVVSYELTGEAGFSGGVNYTIYLRTIGNSINKLSSDLSSSMSARKLESQTLTVEDGQIVWESSSASGYQVVVKNLEDTEVENFETNDLSYILNELDEGYYYVYLRDLGSTYTVDASGYLNSDLSAGLPVYKLATPTNLHINSEFNAETIEELMRIGYLEWTETEYTTNYNVVVSAVNLNWVNEIVENPYYNISAASLEATNYEIYVTSKGDSVLEGAETFYCVNSDRASMNAFKLSAPTNLTISNGVAYWDAPSSIEGMEDIDLQYLFYYNYAPEDEEFDDLNQQLRYTGNREFQTLFALGKYKISVAAAGDNCIRSALTELDETYLFDLFYGGSGTEEDPYLIQSYTTNPGSILAEEHTALEQLAYVNYMYDKHFKIMEDITIDRTFTSIGTLDELSFINLDDGYMFEGSIDGNNHNIIFNRGENNDMAFGGAGNFGFIYRIGQLGEIKNLNFSNFIVGGSYNTIGIVTPENYGTIDYVSVINSESGITSSFNGGNSVTYVGGLVGRNYSTGIVSNSTAKILVNATNSRTYVYAGGIVGYNEGTIENCQNAAIYYSGVAIASQVSGTYSGGIAGYSIGNSATINACVNYASVYAQTSNGEYGSASARAGGIVGMMEFTGSSTVSGNVAPFVTSSYNTGTVSVLENGIQTQDSSPKAGGITGYMAGGTIDSCYNVGSVYIQTTSGQSTDNVGAIVGWNNNSEKSAVINTFYIDLDGIPLSCTVTLQTNLMTKVTEDELKAEDTGETSVLYKLNQYYNAFVYNAGGYPKLSWEA